MWIRFGFRPYQFLKTDAQILFKRPRVPGMTLRWNPEILIQHAKVWLDSLNLRVVPRVVSDIKTLMKMSTSGNSLDDLTDDGCGQTEDINAVLPCKSIVPDSVIRVDYAYMQGYREWFRKHGPFVRQCFLDALRSTNPTKCWKLRRLSFEWNCCWHTTAWRCLTAR